MKVYLDSGVFIDYLSGRGYAGLRESERRGRLPEQLLDNAKTCLSSIVLKHEGMTSCLTCYEVEEAIYKDLRRFARGMASIDKQIVPPAREIIRQTLWAIEGFKFALLDLTAAIVIAQSSDVVLERRGIRSADALHVTTALAHGAEIIITTDSDLLALDDTFVNVIGGGRLRCVDTDAALTLLA